MKVSLNTLKQYIDVELPPIDELVARINSQLGQVEEVIDLGAKYQGATIVKVIECKKHANADKLSVCKIDAGTDEVVQVVCGAPNVQTGMWAVWLPPESTVPSTFDDDEPFVLGARELRGVMSNGMLAAGDELAINSDHDGIIAITEADIPNGKTLVAGANFADMFGLNDTIIDIENKMFTHRPDLFGQLGVAREIKAILTPERDDAIPTEQDILEQGWFWSVPEFASVNDAALRVENQTPALVPRFMAVAMKDVMVCPSPLWLQAELVRWGGKPINTIVDLTNYIMLLTAQPTHAYDYDKLRGGKLCTRLARQGETVTLLNDKKYTLSDDDIVIADDEGVIGLAGIMGGRDTEVSSDTKTIVLEVATFDMYAVRRTSMRHGLFTDALTRFNKGQSKLQNDRVIAHLMTLMSDYASANQASAIVDTGDVTKKDDKTTLHGEMKIRAEFINQRLGLTLSKTAIGNILRTTNFAVSQLRVDSDDLCVTAPFWRTDIEVPEDIVEEVGRLYGYDRLPRELPKRSTKPTPTNRYRELTQRVRECLARAGANEVLTYSFVHERVIAAAGQNATDAYRLSNALSPDLQYYRLSVTPSLLDKVHANSKMGYDEFALFEIGKSHSKKVGLDVMGLPFEPGRIALVYAAKIAKEGAAYYRVKRLLDYLGDELGLSLEYKPLRNVAKLTASTPFVDGRTARVIDQVSGQAIGIIGEYSPATRKSFKLPDYTAGFELFTEGLLLAMKTVQPNYHPLSRYPSVERDVCFEVSTSTSYQQLVSSVESQLVENALQHEITPIDIYQSDAIGGRKRITIRLRLTSLSETLTSETANRVIDEVTQSVVGELGATII